MAMTEDDLYAALDDVVRAYLADAESDLNTLVRAVGVVLARVTVGLLWGTDTAPEQVQQYLAQAFMALEIMVWQGLAIEAYEEGDDDDGGLYGHIGYIPS